MITCLDLVVGVVKTPHPQDVLKQCARFLKNYKHLLNVPYLKFVIDGFTYCTMIDAYEENKEIYILCEIYDGRNMIGTSK